MLHGDWLARHARSTPDAVALVDLDHGRSLTYASLSRGADQAAAVLRRVFGIQPGDRVAVLAANRSEQVELLVACGRIGAILVPLNWRLAVPELAFVLADADPALLLVGATQVRALAGLRAGGHWSGPTAALDESEAGDPLWSALTVEAAPFETEAPVTESTPWMLLYTSGSTGRPKGAVLTHGSMTWNCINTRVGWRLGADETTLVHTPLFHTGGWNVLLLPLLHGGGTVLLTGTFDPEGTLDVVQDHGVTVLFAVPTMFSDLLTALAGRARDLSSLRFAISGGAACPLPVIEAFAARGVPLKQGYGLTEVGPNCFVFPDGFEASRCGSVGLPMPHLEVRLVDEAGAPVAAGQVGELQLRGPTVCAGYWRSPSATASALAGDGWFSTGDLLREDEDGWFSVVGRKKEMFISGGENVYPAEVERVLHALPGVHEAVVVPQSHTRWGEVGHAFLSLEPGASALPTDRVVALCREQLAGYKVPKQVTILPELPKGPTGKLARRQLAERLRP
ncbi:MAG: AMP-binding protein [Deltaproteobacteria bacterium]|nr:AMP-binding protein [Deltaproteobacteria bacterium]